MEKTGLDAALGIEDVPGKLEGMVTGYIEPADYFSVFRNWILDSPNGHRWYRNQVVTLVDEHDQVRKGSNKYRFCGDIRFRDLAFNVMAVQLTTMGIPCIYYGSEQGFDSGGRPNGSDLVLRENMFGGQFGGLCTQGRHFFNEDGDLYRALTALMDLRKKLLPLRRGRQALHRVSGDGVTFSLPHRLGDRMRSLVCWSRLFIDQEVLIAINTDEAQPVAERLIPASDVSNQISTAGYEASGTSNMKFMMNGALTIGTRDGATIEMAEEAGEESFFLFGLTAEQVANSRGWYNPHWHHEHEPETRAALDLIFADYFSRYEPGAFAPLRNALLTDGDHYMHLADLKSYLEADQRLIELYADPDAWAQGHPECRRIR